MNEAAFNCRETHFPYHEICFVVQGLQFKRALIANTDGKTKA